MTKLTREAVSEIEPHVQCLQGIRVLSTGIVNYREVCAAYARIIRREGGSVKTGAGVMEIHRAARGYILETAIGDMETKFLINCGGLQSDRIARRSGQAPDARIVPFRGEYYEIVPQRRYLVKALIYPVPNPAFPFLGVHFTRMVDGSIHAGPNAVLALRREGYRKTDIGLGAVLESLTYPGLWRLGRKHYREGLREIHRSLSKRAFVRSLQQLVPEIRAEDLVPAAAGVRAQALLPNGALVDDFLTLPGPDSIHVCNAPSPAATASLEIGQAVAEQVPEMRMAVTR